MDQCSACGRFGYYEMSFSLPLGSACTSHSECFSGCCPSYSSRCTQPGRLQKCHILPQHGKSYAERQQNKCKHADYCHPVALRCLPALEQGQAVPPTGGSGTDCLTSGECTSGLYCHRPPSVSVGKCRPQGRHGDACVGDFGCVEGWLCVVGKCQKRCLEEAKPGINWSCPASDNAAYEVQCVASPGKPVGLCTAVKAAAKNETVAPKPAPPQAPVKVEPATAETTPSPADNSLMGRIMRACGVQDERIIWAGFASAVVLLLLLALGIVLVRRRKRRNTKRKEPAAATEMLHLPSYHEIAGASTSSLPLQTPSPAREKAGTSSVYATVPTAPDSKQ